MTKENLEVDQKRRDDFNAWYWNRVRSKEGKKYVSKDVGTCGGSINEPFTKDSSGQCCNKFCNVGNSSKSVIMGDEAFKRSVGIQVNVSDKDMIKHYDASDSDDEDV